MNFIDKNEFKKQFGEQLNAAMLEASEPLIQEYLKKVEQRMRQNITAHLVAFIEDEYRCEIQKEYLTIRFGKQEPFRK